MFFEVLVYCFLCVLLCLFSFSLYKKTEKPYILALLALQIIAMVVKIVGTCSGVQELNISIEVYVFCFGILVPFVLFVSDYFKINITERIDLKLGDILLKKGNNLKAIDKYQKALLQNSTNSITFKKLGQAYNAIGDKRTAFDKFARAVELNKNDYNSYYEIGVIFNDLNKKKDAGIVLDNALRIKPDFTKASILLANVLCAQNKFDEAINVYKDAIKYEKENYELYYNLGVIHTELRDFNDALECYKSVIKINPEYSEAYFSIGQIHLLKGEFDLAIESFKSVLFDKEIAPKAYYQIAKVYILKEDEISAVENIQKAIELDPTYRYKAEKESLFDGIKEYLVGMHMISRAQAKLEQEIDKKVREDFEKEYQNEIKDVNFNYLDRFN